jgi:hypothetical protein
LCASAGREEPEAEKSAATGLQSMEQVLNGGADAASSSDGEADVGKPEEGETYVQEQEEIRKSFLQVRNAAVQARWSGLRATARPRVSNATWLLRCALQAVDAMEDESDDEALAGGLRVLHSSSKHRPTGAAAVFLGQSSLDCRDSNPGFVSWRLSAACSLCPPPLGDRAPRTCLAQTLNPKPRPSDSHLLQVKVTGRTSPSC